MILLYNIYMRNNLLYHLPLSLYTILTLVLYFKLPLYTTYHTYIQVFRQTSSAQYVVQSTSWTSAPGPR